MNNQVKMSSVLDFTNLTLNDALIVLLGRPDVPNGRKDRVKAAVAKVSRLLRKPTNQLPAHLQYLLRQLSRFKHESGSPQRKTVANTKSEIRFLVRTVIGTARRSEFAPLTPIWSELRGRIVEPPILWKLCRFIAYCSVHRIAPAEVTDEVVESFHAELAACDDVNQPRQHVRAAIRAWNRAGSLIPAWPGKVLSLPPQRRNRWTIVPANFVIPFKADVQRWLDRLAKQDRLGEDGPCQLDRLAKQDRLGEDGPSHAAKSVTIQHREHQIYKAASALVLKGFPIEKITSLTILTQPENFRAALQFLLDRQRGVPSEALFRLAGALIAVAKHHLKAPQDQLDRLRRMAIGLKPEESGLGVRTEQRLEPFDDERVLAALLHLPRRLLSEAENPRGKPRNARVLAQVAIAIEIEFFTVLRLKNLAHLNLVRDIQTVQQKGKKTWIIRIHRSETKNRSALTCVLPPQSVMLVEQAMKLYSQPNGNLFPGLRGNSKDEGCLSGQIKRTVEGRLGVAFNVHLFRGLGAVLHLKENPNGFESVRAFLGDRDDQVIRSSYTRFAERHLIAAAQETILKSRARTAPGLFTMKQRSKKGYK